ncbi:MAG: hypothetical protein GXO49_02675, partial [Chlorobi bacterium]|nr:hypothetical protein [Chlorobiota bacterium]
MNLGFRNTFLFIVLFGGLVLFSACPSVEDYPEIPQIEFKQVKLYDTIEEALNTKAKVYKLK